MTSLRTFGRIVRDQVLAGGARHRYWVARQSLEMGWRLLDRANRPFASHVLRDQLRFIVGNVHPIPGGTKERARAAVAWLLRAQDATPDRGVSLGYFPCDSDGARWRASYPETTGYIIPSLLDFAERFKEEAVRSRALEMALWETELQMASGAMQGGTVCPPERQAPAVFNTGAVLQGYSAAWRASGDARFLRAARRAGDFLLSDLGPDGHFRTHGPFVTQHRIKTYNCLCGWALYRLGEDCQEERYRAAALRVAEAAAARQQANGWFADNCLTNPDAPLLHTIGYTLQGLLEVGILANRADLVDCARRGTDPVLARMSASAFVPGRFYADWEPAAFSSCLTGSAQLAVVCYRLYDVTAVKRYRAAADRILNYLKALQAIDSTAVDINGALAGSFPIFGGYMTGGYPNWATKYLLDALLSQDGLVCS